MKKLLAFVLLTILMSVAAQADIIVSEVHSTGSSSTTYAKDWFELTNTGASPVNITGWKFDDSTNAIATAFALRNVTSINPGQSVVFIETDTAGTTDAAVTAAFTSAWFGTNVPVGFTIGTYGGAGLSLSSSGDGVNIFDSGNAPVFGLSFGAGVVGTTFDNTAGASGTIFQLSVAGVNSAFTSFAGAELGSPGIAAVPEPSSLALLAASVGLAALKTRRRK